MKPRYGVLIVASLAGLIVCISGLGRVYSQTVQIHPTATQSPSADSAEAHFNRGNQLMHSKDWRAAEAEFDKAIALKPDYAAAYEGSGNCHGRLHEYKDALKDHS